MKTDIFYGIVRSVIDPANGNRIKVEIPTDTIEYDDNGEKIYHFAFPLLPKTLQTMPKVGETVLIIETNPESRNGQGRFYIGPIISQYQYLEKDDLHALSLLNISSQNKIETINNNSDTFGSFPTVEDVALVGRKGEDIILKEDEINIRCGIRNSGVDIKSGKVNETTIGNVIFNNCDPAYIQLKYRRNTTKKNNNSLINLIGDKINLVSTKDSNNIREYMKNLNNQKVFLKEQNNYGDMVESDTKETNTTQVEYNEPDYDELINKLHKVPYGDVLVKVLEIIRRAILEHKHPWPGLPPVAQNVPSIISLKTWGTSGDDTKAVSLEKILLSDTVRIS